MDKVLETQEALEHAARSYEQHSGPESTTEERTRFSADLQAAALRYARAYYAQAREYGLIPEYVRVAPCKACEARRRSGFDGQCPACSGERTRAEMAAARDGR